MEITRNVILDLLPLYSANEVSADSRALIEILGNRPGTRQCGKAVGHDGKAGRYPHPAFP